MLLQVENLEVKYGNIQALHGISFHVNEGEIVTLIGANGAGKTTSLYAITRLPPPEAPRVVGGDIKFLGESILKTRPSDVVKKLHLALSPKDGGFLATCRFWRISGLATYSREKGSNLDAEYDRIFELFPRLKERRNQRSESLSGGEQQMLAVGRALMTGCKILLLDEPSMGLAPVLKYELFRKLKQLNEEGMTILLVEQNANLALHLAHRGYVLDTGNIVAEGTGQELLDNPEVKKAYLGG